MPMVAAGFLPQTTLAACPDIGLNTLDTVRRYFHEARKLWKAPGKFRKPLAMFSASADLREPGCRTGRSPT